MESKGVKMESKPDGNGVRNLVGNGLDFDWNWVVKRIESVTKMMDCFGR